LAYPDSRARLSDLYTGADAQNQFKSLQSQSNGGGDPSKDKKKKASPVQDETFWHGFVRGIPGLGSAAEYKEKFDSGDYWGATAALAMFTFDLGTAGTSTAEKTVTEAVVNTAEKAVVEDETTTVYRSVAGENVKYVGITNNFERRAAEHLASARKLVIDPIMKVSSRADARAVEQALIHKYGLAKDGGRLLNLINSISPLKQTYQQQLLRGYELLNSIGYK
jgi:hypothetical protein